ncbi:uncharacterized protein LOC135463432 [Liolophura sinensis]|uniref:uncharacterized protein LOC135463432 n=1 Tax=Liolophura sinensis TaxID=3198878 RepID=UPI003158D07C
MLSPHVKLWWCASCLSVLLLGVGLAKPRQKDVVVIGAGVAGATVARQLANDPQERYHVTLLEGRENRIGGRLWTDRSSSDALGTEGDLGGALLDITDVHGPFYKLLKRFELTLIKTGSLEIRSAERTEVESGGELDTAVQYLIEKIQTAIIEKQAVEDFSIQEALDFSASRIPLPDKDLWEVILKAMVEPAFGAPLSNLSVNMLEVERLAMAHFIREGMDEIVNRLVSGWDSETPLDVELGKVVRQVQVDQKKRKVKIRTTDRKSITADVVVVAVPLGVLKNGDIFFDPPLSVERKNAINKMGFGRLNKVILRFENMFWPEEPGMFASTADVLKTKNPLVSSWINGYRLTETNALVGYVTGDAAERMEGMEEDQLKEEALKSLAYIFGHQLVKRQKVVSMQRSSWLSDPLSGGSASYYAVGNTQEMRRQLLRPVCPYLYFAGEHATMEKPGCAEGAFLSGLKVAEEIMNGCHDDDTIKRKQKPREEL